MCSSVRTEMTAGHGRARQGVQDSWRQQLGTAQGLIDALSSERVEVSSGIADEGKARPHDRPGWDIEWTGGE
jgi:hypothetical protein